MSGASVLDLLRLRKLNYVKPILDDLGVAIPQDLGYRDLYIHILLKSSWS